MKKVSFICDQCGADLDDSMVLRINMMDGKAKKASYDTCQACWEKLLKSLNATQRQFMNASAKFIRNPSRPLPKK
jgi:hypothetical protein